jgi:hypothetical protein
MQKEQDRETRYGVGHHRVCFLALDRAARPVYEWLQSAQSRLYWTESDALESAIALDSPDTLFTGESESAHAD